MLYDFAAEVGDEWEIKVGTASLLMHVDAEGTVDYNGQTYRTLTVSDPGNLFSGVIICGIGHETSFFPERLMSKGGDYRVEGMRCVWQYGQLIIQLNETSCDEVYLSFHYDTEESTNEGLSVYPNPANGTITISGNQTGEYQIANIMGQTIKTGRIDTEKQQINVSALPAGVYFINIDGKTMKFVKY